MTNYSSQRNPKPITHVPTICVIVFIMLYLYSTSLYPGGSQYNSSAEGFSWIHNYWCNLMNVKADNGIHNRARPYAISSLIILALGLMIFFIHFGMRLLEKTWKLVFIIASIFSMLTAMFIFSEYHDSMTTISSLFGLIVVIGIMREVSLSGLILFKLGAYLCLLALFVNNIIYYTTFGLGLLPMIQKISFALVLIWLIALNYNIERLRADRSI